MTRTALVLAACVLLVGSSVCRADEAKGDTASTKEEAAPPKGDEAPAKSDEAPTKKEAEPAKGDEASAKSDVAPAKEEAVPVKGDAAPAKGEVVPAGHKQACSDGACPTDAPCADCGPDCPGCGKCKKHFQESRGHLRHQKATCDACAACVAPAPCATCGECAGCGEKKSCLKKLCGWLFYWKHTPKAATCHKCCACCCGPLYQFFLCTPIPCAHVGDGSYIFQYSSQGDHDYVPGVVLPPPCYCPVCPAPLR